MTYDERYFLLGVCVGTLLLSPLWTGGAAAETSTMDQWAEECKTVTKEAQRSVQNSKTLGDAFGNIDQDELMKKLLLCQVVTTGNEQATNGEAGYLKNQLWRFFLSDLKLQANGGYTDTVGRRRGFNSGRLDNEEETYGVEVGYFGKPVLRDLCFLFFNKNIEEHGEAIEEAKKTGKGNWDSLVFDAMRLDLNFGFGRSMIYYPEESPPLATSKKTSFTVGFNYSIPLIQLLRLPFPNLPPPLPE